jgi:glycosyltransferase involved in cell wall biosynthesis
MRIALVSEHASPLADLGSVDSGGQNVHVAAIARGLVRRGHEVTVFTRRDDPTPPSATMAADGYAVELVPAGPPTEVPKDELLRYMPAFAAYLRGRWTSQRFDLAHSHFWMSGLAATTAAESLELPVVHTFHALGTVKHRHQGRRDTSPTQRISIEKRLCRTVDHVIATCEDEVSELHAMGMDTRRATVVPCGVDIGAFTPSRVPPKSPLRLVALGRLVERKGVGDVIAALGHLSDVELVIAGGPERDALSADPEVCRLRELARANGTTDRVHFIGRVHHADVPDLLRSADAVVAVPWYEPFGIVPLEAMASGRPVIGSAVGGLLDTVVPGVTGELVPPRRPDLLATAIGSLLGDPERRLAYGRAGYERAARHYRWDRVVAATESVYGEVIARVASRAVTSTRSRREEQSTTMSRGGVTR